MESQYNKAAVTIKNIGPSLYICMKSNMVNCANIVNEIMLNYYPLIGNKVDFVVLVSAKTIIGLLSFMF